MDEEPLESSALTDDGDFVGRVAEMDILEAGLVSARAGHGRLFLLTGEAGIGKTAVAAEFADRARRTDAVVLWGRGWEGGGAPAYWPWIQALRPIIRSRDDNRLMELMGSGAADIAQIFPELHDLFPNLPTLPSQDSESARFQLFDSTTTFLRRAADAKPIVLVLDDLHSADKTSWLFLRFVAGQAAGIKIVIVGTFRHTDLDAEGSLSNIVVDIIREPSCSEIRIGGFGEQEVADFLERATSVRPDPRLVARLHSNTTGNPLYLEQTVRLHAEDGSLEELSRVASQHLPVPSRISDLIARRVELVSERCREALLLGSILGPEFGFETLRRLGDLEADELLPLLDEAVVSTLLVQIEGSTPTFGFSHDLIRETLYEEIASVDRAHLHAKAASVIEATHGHDLDDHLSELAYHYFEAAPAGEADKALDFALRAGARATDSLAYEEAVRLYEMALSALELGRGSDEELRIEILLSLGEVETLAAEDELAKSTFLRASGIAKRLANAEQLAAAAFGYGGIFVWQRAGNDSELVPLLQDALMMLGGADDRLRVRLLSRLACSLRDTPDRETSDALSAEAVKLARSIGDPATLCYALEGRFAAVMWPENPEERLELARELIDLASSHGQIERAFAGYLFEVVALCDLGRTHEADAKLEDLARSARRLRQRNQLFVTQIMRTFMDLLWGNFEDAEISIREALDTTYANRDEFSTTRCHLFLLRREQGRLEEIEEFVHESVRVFPWYPLHRSARACLLAELGRGEEAQQVLDEIARDDFAALTRDNEWLLGMTLAADACSQLGDPATAEILYEQLVPFAGRHSMGWAEGSVGAVDRYLGLLAVVTGRHNAASDHFDRAIAVNKQMGARPWTAHSQYDYGRFLTERDEPGDREAGQELFALSSSTARELGMVALLEKMDIESMEILASHDGETATFRREGEYWLFAFRGEAFRLKDTKGLAYLARLISSPGQEVHVLDLVSASGGTQSAYVDDSLTSSGLQAADDVIDPQARANYVQRLEELRDDLEEAERWGEGERAAIARRDIDFVAQALSGATALGGRSRKTSSAAERARVNVTRAVKTALMRVLENGEEIGQHLESSVHTGTFCSYSPDPLAPITWKL